MAKFQQYSAAIISTYFNTNDGCSPVDGTVYVLPTSLPASLAQVETPSRLSIKLIRWDHCKLPNALDTALQCSATVISTNINTNAIRSPAYKAVFTLPRCPLADDMRVTNPHCTSNELVVRVHKLPNPAKHWPLVGGINKAKRRWKWGCLPAPWPAYALRPPAHCQATSAMLTFLACCCSHAAALIVCYNSQEG